MRSQVGLSLQICRVEDILVEGLVIGSVVHFHRARTISVPSSGTISTTGMGIIASEFLFNYHIQSVSPTLPSGGHYLTFECDWRGPSSSVFSMKMNLFSKPCEFGIHVVYYCSRALPVMFFVPQVALEVWDKGHFQIVVLAVVVGMVVEVEWDASIIAALRGVCHMGMLIYLVSWEVGVEMKA